MKISCLTRRKNTAFTLVEILVVVAIISLLASMIIYNLVPTRDKAKNARITGDLLEYAKALELYRATNNHFPIATNLSCLGQGYTSTCGSGAGVADNPSLNTALKTYFSGSTLPPLGGNLSVNMDATTHWTGASYVSDASGASITITTMLQGDTACPRPPNLDSITRNVHPSGNIVYTSCVYSSAANPDNNVGGVGTN